LAEDFFSQFQDSDQSIAQEQDFFSQFPDSETTAQATPSPMRKPISSTKPNFIDDFVRGASESVPLKVLGGVGKSAADLLIGMGSLEQAGLRKLGLMPDGAPLKEQARQLLGEIGVDLTPKGSWEKIGKFVGDVAPYMTASAGIGNVLKGLQGAKFLGSVPAQIGLKSVMEGLADFSITGAQRGQFDEQAKWSGIVAALLPASIDTVKFLKLGKKSTEWSGKKIIQRQIFSPKQADFKDGFSMDTFVKENIQGNSSAEVIADIGKKMTGIKERIGTLLKDDAQVESVQFINRVIDDALNLANKDIANSKRIVKYTDDMIKGVLNAAKKNNGKLTINQLDDIRQSFGDIADFNSLMATPKLSAQKKVAKIAWSNAKNLLEETVTEGDELNALRKRLSLLIPLKRAAMKKPEMNNNLIVGLMDSIFTAGGLASGIVSGGLFDPKFLAAIALNHAERSPAIGRIFIEAGKKLKDPKIATGLARNFLESSVKSSIAQTQSQ